MDRFKQWNDRIVSFHVSCLSIKEASCNEWESGENQGGSPIKIRGGRECGSFSCKAQVVHAGVWYGTSQVRGFHKVKHVKIN